MAMLKIYTSSHTSGVELIAPKDFKVNVADLDSDKTTRTASGLMNRDRVRARVRSISIDWGYLSRTQMASLIAHFNSDAAFTASNGTSVPSGFFMLEYPDPYSTTLDKRVFYVSDRSVPMFNFNITAPDGTSGMWESLSLTLIER